MNPVDMSELQDALVDARESADRIRQVARDLKLFSKPDEIRRGPVDLHRVIDSSLRMAWNEIRHRARLVKDYGAVPSVEANEGRLGQVFLNLIVNAVQAIGEGNVNRNELRIRTFVDEQGQVVAEVRDTGCGIAPEVLPRLFEPFFTTKPPGIGTGLGLSICRRIIQDLSGSLTVESTLGQGTTFRVALPAARELNEKVSTPTFSTRPASRRGRVLVIDDEPIIAKAVRRALEPTHEVTMESNAAAALEKIRSGATYDVILCDIMMPQMTGIAFHEHLLTSHPQLAAEVVFLTGGAFTREARDFLDKVSNQRVEKPFDALHLLSLVNDRVGATVK